MDLKEQLCDGQDLIWDEDCTDMYFNTVIHNLPETKILPW